MKPSDRWQNQDAQQPILRHSRRVHCRQAYSESARCRSPQRYADCRFQASAVAPSTCSCFLRDQFHLLPQPAALPVLDGIDLVREAEREAALIVRVGAVNGLKKGLLETAGVETPRNLDRTRFFSPA